MVSKDGYDFVIAEYSVMGQFIHHNPLLPPEGLKKYEFNMYRQADKVLTLTPQGKEELLRICPELDVATVPHGVDIDYFTFSPLEESEKSIVFVGNYLHYPNVDAVLYFAHEIWPQIKASLGDIKFYIVGQAPPPEIRSLSQDKNIIVTGRVEDVRPYLHFFGSRRNSRF